MVLYKKRRIFINVATFIILEVASLWILNSNSKRQTWLGTVAVNLQSAVWTRVDNIHSYFHLRAVNDSIAAENARLQKEIMDLRREMSCDTMATWYKLRTNFETMGANVLTMSSGSQHNYIVIDRGRKDGVHADDGLISSKGVVGIVKQVSEHYAQAMTIQHESLTISAKVGHDGSLGTMKWNGTDNNSCTLTGIALHSAVEPGDTVYTSGHTSTFPSEIPLGVVLSKKSTSGSSLKIDVRLFEDLRNIHSVTVVHNLDKDEINSVKQ